MPNTQYSSFRNDVQPNQSMKNVNYQPTPEPSPVPRGQWRAYSYSNCSAECDGGFKKRLVRCLSETGQTLDERYCPHPKPVTQINCANVRCPSWNFGTWSKVSAQRSPQTSPIVHPSHICSSDSANHVQCFPSWASIFCQEVGAKDSHCLHTYNTAPDTPTRPIPSGRKQCSIS